MEVARLGAAELARAGARQRARRHQFDYAVHARHRADTLPNLVAQPLALRIVGRAALDEYGGRFLAAGGGDREGSDVAGLEAGKLLDRPFDVLRPMVAAVDYDHVLGAADDVEVARTEEHPHEPHSLM